MRGSGKGNLRKASAKNDRARILLHNLPATLSANSPTGWWRKRLERRSFVSAWRSLKRPSPRCRRTWQKSAASGRRPSGSATTSVENCTPSESRENPPRRPKRSQRGQSPNPLRERLRRAHRGRGGVGCSGGSCERALVASANVRRDVLRTDYRFHIWANVRERDHAERRHQASAQATQGVQQGIWRGSENLP